MRTLAYIVLVVLLALLAFRMGMQSAVRELSFLEVVICGLLFAAIVLTVVIREKERRQRARAKRDADCAEELDLREINQMLERMERRIESLETILLDPEARIKRIAEHD